MDRYSLSCFSCGEVRRSLVPKKGDVVDDRYELTGQLGRGGMGVVYEALDRRHDERVALKFVLESAQGDPDAERRFRMEIRLARRIRHPNVCAILGDGEVDGVEYIVMEYIEGQDLREYLRSKGSLPLAEAVDLAGQIGAGLQAIHDEDIVHRDLKLANIMRDDTGQVRLMDFGLARVVGESTVTVGFSGSPPYMSPEQAAGQRTDARADIYALGIVTYELLIGSVPFVDKDFRNVLHMHIHQNPSFDDPRIPSALVPVLMKALSKRPQHRQETARVFVEALQSAFNRAVPEPLDFQRTLPLEEPPPSRYVSDAETRPLDEKGGVRVSDRARPGPPPVNPDRGREGRALKAGTTELAPGRVAPSPGLPTGDVAAVAPGAGAIGNMPERARRSSTWGLRVGLLGILFLGLIGVSWLVVSLQRATAPPTVDSQVGIADPGKAPVSEAENREPTPAPTIEQLADNQRASVSVVKTPRKSGARETSPKPPQSTPAVLPTATVSNQVSPAKTGFLQVGAAPFAAVFIDGVSKGETPMPPIELPPGKYTIRFEKQSDPPVERTVTIEAGRTTKEFVSFVR